MQVANASFHYSADKEQEQFGCVPLAAWCSYGTRAGAVLEVNSVVSSMLPNTTTTLDTGPDSERHSPRPCIRDARRRWSPQGGRTPTRSVVIRRSLRLPSIPVPGSDSRRLMLHLPGESPVYCYAAADISADIRPRVWSPPHVSRRGIRGMTRARWGPAYYARHSLEAPSRATSRTCGPSAALRLRTRSVDTARLQWFRVADTTRGGNPAPSPKGMLQPESGRSCPCQPGKTTLSFRGLRSLAACPQAPEPGPIGPAPIGPPYSPPLAFASLFNSRIHPVQT